MTKVHTIKNTTYTSHFIPEPGDVCENSVIDTLKEWSLIGVALFYVTKVETRFPSTYYFRKKIGYLRKRN